MPKMRDVYPGPREGYKWYPQDFVSPLVPVETGNIWFVDGDKSANGGGKSWEDAFADLESAADNAALTAGDVIYVAARTNAATDTDPVSYTENVTLDTPQVSIIGVSRGRTQGGLPQLKVGSTTTQAILRVRAPGCQIINIGFNGNGGTGGGVRLDDDGGTTYASFGTTVAGCHFKNCVGPTATSAATGGAVQISGAPWQIQIIGNKFYKNAGGVVLLDTTTSVPQDLDISYNSFAGSAAAVDCDIYLAGGGGPGVGLVIRGNDFNVFPALGAIKLWMDLTGADGGVVAENYFADDKTFGIAGTGAKVPTTVFLSGNYDEGGLIARV